MADQKKSPGDNRGADDVDGNKSAGASKARGVREPEVPAGPGPSGERPANTRDEDVNR